MFTKQPTLDMDIEFDIKLLATEYYEGTVCITLASSPPSFLFLLLFTSIITLKWARDRKKTISECSFIEFIVVQHLLQFRCDDCQAIMSEKVFICCVWGRHAIRDGTYERTDDERAKMTLKRSRARNEPLFPFHFSFASLTAAKFDLPFVISFITFYENLLRFGASVGERCCGGWSEIYCCHFLSIRYHLNLSEGEWINHIAAVKLNPYKSRNALRNSVKIVFS